ncbi:MAG TPA: alkaline phosphatase family protein [Nitrospirota bacterium]|nr:alkaline phosphatase family protein [Nitrospirota bacterium]
MKKVFIIGIDSATFDIMTPMMVDGDLPNIARLVRSGTSGRLMSTVPPVTPPAWVSFMTGKNPGKHGVFDFYVPPSYGYNRPVLNSGYIKAKTIWRILSDHGLRVGVINLPMTYPPEDVKGFIIPGMQYSFNGGEGFSHPPELLQEIKARVGDYRVLYGDLESLYTDNLEVLLKEWREIFEIRRKAILYLMENKEWDVFMAVFYSIDVMQHHFWRFYDHTHPLYDPRLAAKYGDVIPEFYKKIDSAIGEILQRLDDSTYVMVVSDHGAGPEEEGFSINSWLCKEGFLNFKTSLFPLWRHRFPHLFYKILKRAKFPGIAWTVPLNRLRDLGKAIDPREGLDISYFIDWKNTRAFGGNHTEQGIYINLRGREPMGIVEKGKEYEDVREAIIERLGKIEDPETGRPIKVNIVRKEEVYDGPCTEDAPDIFVEIRDSRCLIQKEIHHRGLFNKAYKSSGTHRAEGIVILKGDGINAGCTVKGANITDLTPTILYALGLPVPDDMDGKVMVDAFGEDYLVSNPVRSGSPTEISAGRGRGVFNEEESDKIKMSLRDLGYFG